MDLWADLWSSGLSSSTGSICLVMNALLRPAAWSSLVLLASMLRLLEVAPIRDDEFLYDLWVGPYDTVVWLPD